MTTTLETIALIVTLGIAVTFTTTSESTTIGLDATSSLCVDPAGGGAALPPPPQN